MSWLAVEDRPAFGGQALDEGHDFRGTGHGGYLGLQPATGIFTALARVFTVLYFAFFLLMPWYTRVEKTKPVPERVTMR